MLGANCSLQFDWFLASGSVSQQHINKEMTGIDAARYWNSFSTTHKEMTGIDAARYWNKQDKQT